MKALDLTGKVVTVEELERAIAQTRPEWTPYVPGKEWAEVMKKIRADFAPVGHERVKAK